MAGLMPGGPLLARGAETRSGRPCLRDDRERGVGAAFAPLRNDDRRAGAMHSLAGEASPGRGWDCEDSAGSPARDDAPISSEIRPASDPAPGVRCYLTYMRTTISTKGQIVLPAELRAADDIKAGEEFEVDRVGPDEYRLTRLTPPPNRGLVEWLRSCPDDGWFVEIESESTDSL